MGKTIKILLHASLLCYSILSIAQQPIQIKEIGTPIIDSYLPTDYNASGQVWAIARDSTGLIYIGNTEGLLQFDGTDWKEIPNPDDLAFMGLYIDSNNKIYYGTINGFGYLEIDSTKSYTLHHLRPAFMSQDEKIGQVHTILKFRDQIIFKAYKRIYILHLSDSSFSTIESDTGFKAIFNHNDKLIVQESRKGLMEMRDGKFVELPGMENYRDYRINTAVPFSNNEILCLSSTKGLYKYDYNEFTYWDVPVFESLKGSRIDEALNIQNQYISIVTRNKGICIIDQNGRLVQNLDKHNGLNSKVIYAQMLDDDNSLWVGTNSGYNHVYINSPFSLVTSKSGLEGSAIKLTIHNDYMYAATHEGIFWKKVAMPWQNTTGEKVFNRLEDIYRASWTFASAGTDLFCGTRGGLVQINEDQYELLSSRFMIFLYQLDEQTLMGVGNSPNTTQNIFLKRNGKWEFEKEVKGINEYVDFMVKEEDGTFWISDSDKGLFSYNYTPGYDSIINWRSYDKSDGLPEILGLRVFIYRNQPVVGTRHGLYHLDRNTNRFVHDTIFSESIGDKFLYRFKEGPTGNIYISGDMGKGFLNRTKDQGYNYVASPFVKFERNNDEFIFHESSNSVYILSNIGLIHYDPSIEQNHSNYNTVIRSVHTTTSGDSLIYGGDGVSGVVTLPFTENALRFSYKSTFSDESDKTQFRTRLSGYEDSYSDWTLDTEREYTNLSHGNYELVIQSRNIYGKSGMPAQYLFSITPPWYFTNWAYASYFITAVLFIWGLLKINSRRLIREKLALEAIITDRTSEIQKQKVSLEKQAKKLRELDAVKSRFFANISHELRTPLTLIKGPINALFNGEYGSYNKEVGKNMEIVQRNSENLLVLVEEILDLAKLESGKLKLVENPVRFKELIEQLILVYTAEADSRGIKFSLNYKCDNDLSVLLDEQKFSKIINNLLSNAFKFTEDGGQIDVDVYDRNDDLSVSVSDNGAGIHPDDIDHIFERYYQSEQSDAKTMGGAGIGLALSKELASLNNGNLTVESQYGQGTRFILTIKPKTVETIQVAQSDSPMEQSKISDSLSETLERYIDVYTIDKPTVLLTEDYKDMRDFVYKIIGSHFNVIEAADGLEALSKLKKNRIDMIISDVMMPKMDGFELLQHIKANVEFKDISIIMLTARSAEQDKLFALTLGVDDYLTKPFSNEELLVRTRNIFENRISRKLSLNGTHEDQSDDSNVDTEFIIQLKDIIVKNLSDSLLSVSYLASQVAMSERQLLRKLKGLTGYSAIQFIKEIKLQEAKLMLENRRVESVADASYRVGFDKVNYFSSLYIERFGIRPSESLSR